MKAISIRQPWAWLIAAGFKDVENRPWKRNYRGPILIHASKTTSRRERVEAWDFVRSICRDRPDEWAKIFKARLKLGTPCRVSLPTGAIIGQAEIVDVVTESESPWFVGPFGFVIANAKLWNVPYPCKGALGLFEAPYVDPYPTGEELMAGLPWLRD